MRNSRSEAAPKPALIEVISKRYHNFPVPLPELVRLQNWAKKSERIGRITTGISRGEFMLVQFTVLILIIAAMSSCGGLTAKKKSPTADSQTGASTGPYDSIEVDNSPVVEEGARIRCRKDETLSSPDGSITIGCRIEVPLSDDTSRKVAIEIDRFVFMVNATDAAGGDLTTDISNAEADADWHWLVKVPASVAGQKVTLNLNFTYTAPGGSPRKSEPVAKTIQL